MEPSFMDMFLWSIVPTLVEALAVFIGVFFGLLLASKRIFPNFQANAAATAKTASEIVRERYAKGEISRREYEQMREDLEPETAGLAQSGVRQSGA